MKVRESKFELIEFSGLGTSLRFTGICISHQLNLQFTQVFIVSSNIIHANTRNISLLIS